MLHHVVMIQLNNDADDAHREAFKARLLAMRETIPQIRAIDVQLDEFGTQRSWDVLLHLQFESHTDLEAYLAHPDHRAVIAFNRAYQTAIATIDYHA